VASANGLKDPNLIRPGQKGLKVPGKAGQAEPKPAKVETPVASKPVGVTPPAQPKVETPKVEQPPVEPQPKVEPQPEAPKTEQPAPEQPAAPAQPKKHHRFLWFGKKDKPETPAEPTPAQPVVPTPAQPVAADPQPTAQDQGTDPAAIAAKENSEVNLLMQGVADGKFTRNEFMALNATANQYTELRTNYAKDGFTQPQMVELAQVQQQYGQMYARFLADDKAKVTFAGGESQDPAARFRAQQNEQGVQFYDQFQNRALSPALR